MSGSINIYGGNVRAVGGASSAGIGGGAPEIFSNIYGDSGNFGPPTMDGGFSSNDGTVNIWGGTVYASNIPGSKNHSCGIGAGKWGNGIDVHIYGGRVTAIGSDDGCAIGGYDTKDDGTLEIAPHMRVMGGEAIAEASVWDTDPERYFTAAERVAACQNRHFAIIESCTHPKDISGFFSVASTYTLGDDDEHHDRHCPYCELTVEETHAFKDINCVCGDTFDHNTDVKTVTIFSSADGTAYADAQTDKVAQGNDYVLPVAPYIDGLTFMGYLKSDTAPTGIVAVDTDRKNAPDGWYDLQGRRLSGKPTARGLYIYQGRKIAIK